MKTQFLQILGSLAVVTFAGLTSGCATPALWKHTATREWKPESPDQLLLVATTNQEQQVAVLFHQFAVTKDARQSRPVAWCLSQSPTNLIIGVEAVRQFTNSFSVTQTIPMFSAAGVPGDASSAPPGYAVWNSTNDQLTIHVDGQPPGAFTLPASQQARKTAARILVMPFAVAADAAITGAVLFGIGAGGLGAVPGP